MSGFPLYDNLIKNLPKKDLTAKQKEEIINNIKVIDEHGKELVFALIQFYYLNNEKTGERIPYNGEDSSNDNKMYDIKWNLMDFPIKLRHILHKFLSMHFEKLKQEENRNF